MDILAGSFIRAMALLSLGAVLSIGIQACGGGGGDDDTTTTMSVTVPVGNLITKPTIVTANGITKFEFTPDLDQDVGPFSAVTIDLASTINAIQVTENFNILDYIVKTAQANHIPAGQATVTAYIATDAEVAVVCNGTVGVKYGPFTVSVDAANQLVGVDPPTATATQETVNVINSGSMAICIVVDSHVGGNMNVDSLDFEVEDCNKPLEIIAGTWIGKFTCINSPVNPNSVITCDDDIDEDVSLTITQNGDRATYNDGTATYSGTVCGDHFNFNGGIEISEFVGFDESGKFVMNDDDRTAFKESKWLERDDSCMGTCTDSLTRK